jgi:N-acetylglucosamine kinase-like BadF-type ATPase
MGVRLIRSFEITFRPKLGDTGNAWSIGNKILGAVARSVDGVGPETQLVNCVKEQLNLNEMSELIPYIYQDHQWSRVADFAPLATKCYETDQVAKDIILSEVDSLYNLAKGAAKKLGWNPTEKKFTLVLCGSVLTHEGSTVANLLMEKVKKEFHHVEVTLPKCEPSLGAALLAVHRLKKK